MCSPFTLTIIFGKVKFFISIIFSIVSPSCQGKSLLFSLIIYTTSVCNWYGVLSSFHVVRDDNTPVPLSWCGMTIPPSPCHPCYCRSLITSTNSGSSMSKYFRCSNVGTPFEFHPLLL